MEALVRLYYQKYKKNLIPVTLIFASLFMIFRIALPQFSGINQTRSQIDAKEQELTTAQQTLSTINALSAEIDENIENVQTALPVEKDITLIFSALTSAAEKADVTLSDYSIKVGNIFEKETKPARKATGTPEVTVNATIRASDSASLLSFSKEMYDVLPLAEVRNVRIVENEANLEMRFFYKPVDVAALSRVEHVAPLTPQEQAMLENFREKLK